MVMSQELLPSVLYLTAQRNASRVPLAPLPDMVSQPCWCGMPWYTWEQGWATLAAFLVCPFPVSPGSPVHYLLFSWLPDWRDQMGPASAWLLTPAWETLLPAASHSPAFALHLFSDLWRNQRRQQAQFYRPRLGL